MSKVSAWLSIMPAIELRRSVPIVYLETGDRVIVSDTGDGMVWFADGDLMLFGHDLPVLFRVDLDDPQGFAYALEWLGHRAVLLDGNEWPVGFLGLVRSLVTGTITVGQRMMLANACQIYAERDAEWARWKGVVQSWGHEVSAQELDVLLNRPMCIQLFGPSFYQLKDTDRVHLVRGYLAMQGEPDA